MQDNSPVSSSSSSSILSRLETLAQRLDASTISHKSAQVIPYAWSTTYEGLAIEYDIGIPSCDCTWWDGVSQFCGMMLVHQDQTHCPSCGTRIVHVKESVYDVARLMHVARRLSPRAELVDRTLRSRSSVQCLKQALTIHVGRTPEVMMGHKKEVPVDKHRPDGEEGINLYPKGYQIVYEKTPFSRVIIIASDVRLRVSHRVNVVWSDGIEPETGQMAGTLTYASLPEAANKPVIFSISGGGTRLVLEPLDPAKGMVLYEVTLITGDGTSIEPPGLVHLYPELRHLQHLDVPSRLQSLVSVTDESPSPALMHSSNNCLQSHDLMIWWTAEPKNHLVVTLGGDPVLCFFDQKKRLLRVYTGTNVYRLVVLSNPQTGIVEWYSMRETIDIDDHHSVRLVDLVRLYGDLCSTVAIETMLLIQCAPGEVPGFAWECVPVQRKVYVGPSV